MAMINRLDALLVIGPRPSIAVVKMVGNMIELNSPIASTLHIANIPCEDIVAASSAIAASANSASNLRASILVISPAPTKRPIIAPPQ